jgi:hypothetical protein
MDIGLYARVLWRFKPLVVLGLIVAISLAALSMLRISTSGKVAYRQSALYASTARLGVTQRGFPWGRLFAEEPSATAQAALGIPVADPNRLNNLAVLYAELATSDPVRQLIRRDGPIVGKLIASPVVRGDNQIMLPLIDLTAIATSPEGAIRLARRSATAFRVFITTQQAKSNVPQSDRVIVQNVIDPRKAAVYQPRSKTMPIVVFLAVMFATVGLAFLLENLRPRAPRGIEVEAEPAAANAPARLSA